MSEPELKPCPFCGGTILGFTYRRDRKHRPGDAVHCGMCGAYGPLLVDTKEEAIAKWNSRVVPKEQP